MKRVAIVGVQGSGKSTFANKLGKLLSREVTHLDKLYYKPGWQPVSNKEWKKVMMDLVRKEEWIIDGNYQGSLKNRLDRADTIVFFSLPKWVCIFRAFKRAFQKSQPFDKVEGNREKVSWKLIKSIFIYPKKKVLNTILSYHPKKKIYIINQSQDADELLIRLNQ